MKANKFKNIDPLTVKGFGDEWKRFDQSGLKAEDKYKIFEAYFSIFPWNLIKADSVGFDLGCGSGRWASIVAPRVGILHCIDPSDAIEVARRNLSENKNCLFHRVSVDDIPFKNKQMDFGYSLGVLHHIPNTMNALKVCVKKLKPGAPFLLYLYYAFDNRPPWFRFLWRVSDIFRRFTSSMPYTLRYLASQIIAILIYFPFARTAKYLEKIGFDVASFPLSFYRDRGFYVMKTDALDRFGTRLEQRFTKLQIVEMMKKSGLENIQFNNGPPYWCAIGFAKDNS